MARVVVYGDDAAFVVVRKVCDEAGLHAVHAQSLATLLQMEASVVVSADRESLEELQRALPDAFVACLASLDEAAVASALQAAFARHRAPTTPPHARISLLLVEPDPGLSVVMKRWLGHAYDVTVVSTGTRAFEEIHTVPPDAVLSELYLPDMDASELHAAIGEIEPGLPARTLFMVGGLVGDHARHFLARIPSQWIAKPFTLAQLRDALARLSA